MSDIIIIATIHTLNISVCDHDCTCIQVHIEQSMYINVHSRTSITDDDVERYNIYVYGIHMYIICTVMLMLATMISYGNYLYVHNVNNSKSIATFKCSCITMDSVCV